MNIWPYEITDQGLSGNAKSLKTELPSAPVCKLVLVTTLITKIHGLHVWREGKTLNKTYVELMGISCTQKSWQK